MTTTIHNNRVTSRKVRVQRNYERHAFLYMRVSGLLLLFLAMGHLVFQLLINNVADLSVAVVTERWQNGFYRFNEWLLLIFSLSHGLNGLKNVLEDYIHNESAMRIIRWTLLIFFVVTIVVVSYALAAFPRS
jgi:succinate dehydrogenase / fumarate reductase membrane anchor subunit